MIKAICLLSGGLDSILAARIIQEQGVECIGLHISSPFFQDKIKTIELVKMHAAFLKIPLFIEQKQNDYVQILRNPKHGYGKGLNPCTDCHTYYLNIAKESMKEKKAQFIVTGDVVGQRANSQLKKQLQAIEESTGMEGLIVRPLSGKFMQETIPELKGWISREMLLDIHGKGKKAQAQLAKKYNIPECSSLSGGCLLAEKRYSLKLRDLLDQNAELKLKDVEILTIGRHFRFGSAKIVVGRNNEENQHLRSLAKNLDIVMEVQNYGSPITLLQYPYTAEEKKFAARLTALYSDCNTQEATVKSLSSDLEEEMIVEAISFEDANKYNIALMNFDGKKRLIKKS